MGKYDKLLFKILNGRSDNNIAFTDTPNYYNAYNLNSEYAATIIFLPAMM